MPWDASDAPKHNKNANTKEKRKRWAATANSVLRETGDDARAIRIANHAIKARTTKEEVDYQSVPNGSEQCSKCTNFVPGGNPFGNNECLIVEGNIAARGWCEDYNGRGIKSLWGVMSALIKMQLS